LKILWTYLKPHRGFIILSLSLAGIAQLLTLVDPIIFGKIIDDYTTNPGSKTESELVKGVSFWLAIAIVVALMARLAKTFQEYVMRLVVQRFGMQIFNDGLKQTLRLSFEEFEGQRSGETLSVLQKVRTDTERFISTFINVLFPVIIGIVFVAVYAITIDWRLPLVYFGGIFMLTWISNLLSKKVKTIQKHIVSQTTSLAGATTESLRNIELVKSLGLTKQEVDRLNKNTFKILGLELTKVKRIRSISFIQGTFVNTLRQVILFMLMMLVFSNQMTAGEIVTMQIFSFFVFGPLQEIGNIILSYREAQASLENFETLMKKAPEPQSASPKHLGQIQTLEFDHVGFKHRTAAHKAINDISFKVKTGETIAFVGPSGSGKTTLMKLLVGLYRPQEGRILYNGIDENNISFDDLRNQIGFVTQDTQLFSGTIRENLTFVNPSATEEDLRDVLQKASANNLLVRAEKGLDTMIGEGGLKLSGGEKQRLSIARALLRRPKLLLFDEATSALDSLTEEEITDTIREISLEGTQVTILIAHRLSTIMHADRIYVLEKGDVVETGSHEMLLAEKGLYYAMWRQQIGERKTKIPAA
jgi:ATP-binding cassette subfamily B protein